MTLKREVKLHEYLHCYGAIDGQVRITTRSMIAQRNNPDKATTMIVDHDGELKKVSQKLLYHDALPAPTEYLKDQEAFDIRTDLAAEGLL